MMAGFRPYPLSSKVMVPVRNLLKEFHGNYGLQEADGALYLGWMQRALVTFSAWKKGNHYHPKPQISLSTNSSFFITS